MEFTWEKANNLQSNENANCLFQVKQLCQSAPLCYHWSYTPTDEHHAHGATVPRNCFPSFMEVGQSYFCSFLVLLSPLFSSLLLFNFCLHSSRHPDHCLKHGGRFWSLIMEIYHHWLWWRWRVRVVVRCEWGCTCVCFCVCVSWYSLY